MALQSATRIEIAEGRRSALDYPNIRAVELAPEQLAATPKQTLGLALFIVHAIRQFERWLLDHAELVHGPLHSSIGQEAVAAGMALALERSDKITSTHRAHHDVLAKLITYAAPADFDPATAGEVPAPVLDAVLRTFAEILGLDQGLCGGRGGSMHLADVDGGIMTSAIVGGGIPVSAGQALAAKLRANGGVALASFGDGATSIGAFHEAAALSRAWDLPMIFLLENNQYSVATTLRETAGFSRAGDPGQRLRHARPHRGRDGPDRGPGGDEPRRASTRSPAARCSSRRSTYRYYHQNGPLPGSAFKYRTKDEEQHWATLDPVKVFPAPTRRGRAHDHGGGRRTSTGLARALVALVRRGGDRGDSRRRAHPARRSTPRPRTSRRGVLGPGVGGRGARAPRCDARRRCRGDRRTAPQSPGSSRGGWSVTRRRSSSARRSAISAAASSASRRAHSRSTRSGCSARRSARTASRAPRSGRRCWGCTRSWS